MTRTWKVDFTEEVARNQARSIPLAHMSIEIGHLYFEEFAGGPQVLARHFERVAPWVEAARQQCARSVPSGRPRVSSCFLIDDYFTRFSSPAEVLPQLLAAAAEHDVAIDYVARESACVTAGGVPLADLVLDRLVPDPAPGTTGLRPPTAVSGWLCNGQRSPNTAEGQAMTGVRQWRPPTENGAVHHSIFLDVELWNEDQDGGRRWSCPFLASVWQLLRLGLLRYKGEPVAVPVDVDRYPDDWERLPAVVRVNPAAQPFSAYRTFSVLGTRFLPIEHAVRTILQRFAVERTIADQVRTRSSAEHVPVGAEVCDQIEYLFTGY